MKARQLGNSDLHITPVGVGTWAIGGGEWKYGWGSQDDEESVAAIVRAIELGINWIDTAAAYGGGHSEVQVGKALRVLGERDRPIVATKCSRIVQPDGSVNSCLKAQSVKAEVDASLRRLGVECIDLMQVHWPDPPEDLEEGWGALAECVRAGKARWIGASNFSVEQMRRCQTIHPIASLQPPYSMLNRGIEAELLPFCAEQNIGVIVYSPMHRGLLTGGFSHERVEQLDPTDHRRNAPDFQDPALSATLTLVEKLRPIAEEARVTPAQLAIAWTLRRNEVTAAIVGARRPEQVEETARAGDVTLTRDQLARIDALIAERDRAIER